MKKQSLRMIWATVSTVVLGALVYYVTLPALNVFSQGFWVFLAFLAAVFGVVYFITGAKGNAAKLLRGAGSNFKKKDDKSDQKEKSKAH